MHLIEKYLLNKYKTKLLIGDKGKYIITDVIYIFKQDKVNNIDYYVYWDYTLVNVSGFEVGTYFESLNRDILAVILSKLKYGSILRTIYNDKVSDNQIFHASNIPQIIIQIFNNLKLRYQKHPNIFGELNAVGLTYALNIDTEKELFDLEEVYPFLKDKIMSVYIENVSKPSNKIFYKGNLKDLQVRFPQDLEGYSLAEYTQYFFRKYLKYDFNNFYIYITPKTLTLLDMGYQIINRYGDLTRAFFNWKYLYGDLWKFDRDEHLDNYRISKINPSEKKDQFLSIISILRDDPRRQDPLSSTHPCLYIVCCLIIGITPDSPCM